MSFSLVIRFLRWDLKFFDIVVFGVNDVLIGSFICFLNINLYGEYCVDWVVGDIWNVIIILGRSFG